LGNRTYNIRSIPAPYQEGVSSLISLLQQLQINETATIGHVKTIERFPFSVKLLKDTGAGQILKKIGSSCGSEAISSRVKALCEKWKEEYHVLKQQPSSANIDEMDSLRKDIHYGLVFEDMKSWRQLYFYC
jgi:hypothetical protein